MQKAYNIKKPSHYGITILKRKKYTKLKSYGKMLQYNF